MPRRRSRAAPSSTCGCMARRSRPSYTVRRAAQVVPVAATLRRRPLHARQRRQAPHRGVRPGRALQQLHRRCAGRGHAAADRRGRGARPDHGATRQRHRRTAEAGFIRDPSVAVEIETYRPFFVLGEVTFPGQYPYVPNMTVENAIAIAGGFTPRAYRRTRSPSPARCRACRPAPRCRCATRCAPATPSKSPNAGSDHARSATLKIVHVTRTPVGGIFRHILDVARGQAARGHHVGIVCDSTTGGARAEAALAAIAPQMKLGVSRFAMPREIGPGDVTGFRAVSRHLDFAQSRRAARPRRQGRRLRAADAGAAARSASTRRTAARCTTGRTRCAASSMATIERC